MTQGTSSGMSLPYLLLFSGIYFALLFVTVIIGIVLPGLVSVNGFVSLIILVLPAWIAARRFLRVEDRAPTTREAVKLAIMSFLIALAVDLFVISLAMRIQGVLVAEQLSSLQKTLVATIASGHFWLLAGMMLGFSALKVLCIGIIYRTIGSGKTPQRA